ncbi:MAG TPA: hypothetical protein EYN06_07350 [Myxococcales bacterium]|nr:hypothetical protein [Myxococcales bacterium]
MKRVRPKDFAWKAFESWKDIPQYNGPGPWERWAVQIGWVTNTLGTVTLGGYVCPDEDDDGIINSDDKDIDGDGALNSCEGNYTCISKPPDWPGGKAYDTDDDQDGVLNENDPTPHGIPKANKIVKGQKCANCYNIMDLALHPCGNNHFPGDNGKNKKMNLSNFCVGLDNDGRLRFPYPRGKFEQVTIPNGKVCKTNCVEAKFGGPSHKYCKDGWGECPENWETIYKNFAHKVKDKTYTKNLHRVPDCTDIANGWTWYYAGKPYNANYGTTSGSVNAVGNIPECTGSKTKKYWWQVGFWGTPKGCLYNGSEPGFSWSVLEICDGYDNDNNGQIDDGAADCVSGEVCQAGKCVNVNE